MRLSVLDNKEFHKDPNDIFKIFAIRLNGMNQYNCVIADEEKGYIDQILPSRSATLGQPMYKRSYGKVQILLGDTF